jgi:hypothetical protein
LAAGLSGTRGGDERALVVLKIEGFGEGGRDRVEVNAEVAAGDFAGLHEAVGDLADEIRGDGEADALETAAAAEDGGVDAEEAAVDVDERAAGVAGVDRGVGLDEVLVAFDLGEMPMLRPLALTMPLVTVSPIPKGLPMARTRSPTSALALSAKVTAGRSLASIFTTARSVCGSRPTTLALNSRPSVRATVTTSAPSITWLLVTT